MSTTSPQGIRPELERPPEAGPNPFAADVERYRIALIVPTYRRPTDLERCLQAIAKQCRRADQVIIVVRDDDEPTRSLLNRAGIATIAPSIVTVREGGQVAALNAGLEALDADADLVAFTDDDAAPRPEWLQQIAAAFAADPRLGGLGGRDWVHQHGRVEDGSHPVVGRITWFGRCIGRHHLGEGPAREVDVLKGANMSFRARAIEHLRFDTRLRGAGAQVCNDLGLALAVKRRGWKLVYDPRIAVDHYGAVRHDEDQRTAFSGLAVHNATFNETLVLCEYFAPWRRYVFIAWALLVGHRASPGLLQWLRLSWIEPRTATARFRASCAARLAGWRTARRAPVSKRGVPA